MRIAAADVDLYGVLQVDPEAHPNVITAAYRALARLLHPDQTQARRDAPMARLNRAYAVLRDPEQRRAYDRERAAAAAGASPRPERAIVTPPPRPRASTSPVLAHGRYVGWSLEQVARRDPDYLRWLARQMSGRQYRAEIDRLLSRRPAASSSRSVA